MHMTRSVVREARARHVGGSGTRVVRSDVGILDPFLLLDEIHVQRPLPKRRHSGFEVVTYVIAGSLVHPGGTLRAGGVDWLTTGRGVMHSETPDGDGALEAFRLWINLPAAEKSGPPRHRAIAAEDIPVRDHDRARVRVVADGCGIAPVYLDVALQAGASFVEDLPAAHNGFVYVLEGEIDIGARRVPAHHVAVLGHGDRFVAHGAGVPSRFLLIAGKPLCEPIAWDGTVVMSSRDELARAIAARAE